MESLKLWIIESQQYSSIPIVLSGRCSHAAIEYDFWKYISVLKNKKEEDND